MFQFLQAFFQLHPEYAKNEFFVTGESYAGHYVPAVTSRIHQANKRQEGVPINLKGFAIGNGLTNPEIQYAAYADYALQMGLINKTVYQIVSDMYPECQEAIQKCGNNGSSTCSRAYSVCTSIFNTILYFLDDVNYYDIRKKCDGNLCYDFSNMETYLNQNSVKQALNVGDIDFVSCNSLVYENMVVDWMRNLEVGIPALLDDGIQLLVYAGEYDLICNWLGNARWVSVIEWSGSDNYRAANFTKFAVDGEEAGLFISYGPLTFLKVHNAGHMVPMDQPKASLDMIMRFTQGGSLDGVSFPREIVYSTSRNTER
ncbi:hypothetical protein KP509_28G050100 [Ceratopteris richardii]|nr:hypothetical protein KP509_28G050100 [Ceratopteris richardii]